MTVRKAILKTAASLSKKYLVFREKIIFKDFLSIFQKLLNHETPPRRGQNFENNTVVNNSNGTLILKNNNGKIIMAPFRQGIFHVYLRGAYQKTGWLEHTSWTIDHSNNSQEGWNSNITDNHTEFTCTLTNGSAAELKFMFKDGAIYCYIGSDLELIKVSAPQISKKWLIVESSLLRPGEVKVFGLGENTPPMNKAGQHIVMWNTSPLAYRIGANPLYQTWPAAIFQYADGPACGLVFDNPGYSVCKFSADGKKMRYAVKDTELSFYILFGPTLPELMRQLAALTGSLPPLPKWVLGYQQSRWSYTPSSRVREVAAEFRKRDIPCDVIHLDIDYMERYKCFTWGKGFEDYKELIGDLHSSGFKVVTILDPALKIEQGYEPYETGVRRGMFVNKPGGNPVAKPVWAGLSHFPDFVNPIVREWWGEMVSKFAECGVDGIWCDMNEPTTFNFRTTLPKNVIHKMSGTARLPHELAHNVYGYLMSMATYEGLLEVKHLPYVITRSTYLGGQKFAVTWTGDVPSSWDFLRASVPMILNLGLSGQPLAGPDIGGYTGNPPPALYERWILQGALYPFSRTHSKKNSGSQEPWCFGPEVEASARWAIKLRYLLVPYLYSLLYEAAQSGQPLMRPIFYHEPTAEALKPEFCETQFLLGPFLLVSPLMGTAPTRTCYLPSGIWYSWWSRKEHTGGGTYETKAEEDGSLPLFVRENSVIPVYPESLSYIPDHSLSSLEIIITVQDKAAWLIVEYFDRESLLAYDVEFLNSGGLVEGKINVIRRGNVPACYQPPETMYLRINHRIHKAVLRSGCKDYSVAAAYDDESWTIITINNPAFPYAGSFITVG